MRLGEPKSPVDPLLITIDLSDCTAERTDALTRALRSELLSSEVDSVVPAPELTPPGAKSGLGQSVGVLLVSGTFTAAALSSITQIVKAWLDRAKARAVTIERGGHKLTLAGASHRDQRAVVEEWIRVVSQEKAPDASLADREEGDAPPTER